MLVKCPFILMSSWRCHLVILETKIYSYLFQSYLDFFIRGLRYEYKDTNITFQCLTPFYVATHMTKYSPILSNPCLWIPSAAVYARNALRTIGYVDKTTGYWPHTVQVGGKEFEFESGISDGLVQTLPVVLKISYMSSLCGKEMYKYFLN